jgi:hypothetical protein
MGGRADDGDPLGMKLKGLASWNRKCVVGRLDASLRRGVHNMPYLLCLISSHFIHIYARGANRRHILVAFRVILFASVVFVPVIVDLLGYTLLSTNP